MRDSRPQRRQWYQIHLGSLLAIVVLFALSFSLHPVVSASVAGSIIGAFLSQFPAELHDHRIRQCFYTVIGGSCGSIGQMAVTFLRFYAELSWQGELCPELRGLMVITLIGACVGFFTWVSLRIARYY
jgi:hypothetical protein